MLCKLSEPSVKLKLEYSIYQKYWDKLNLANSADTDQMPMAVAFNQGHCLPFIQKLLRFINC